MKYQIKPTDRGDHILESVVPTSFGGDAVNYVFRGRLEDCEKMEGELMKGESVMKKMTIDIEVSPWLTEEGLHINLYAGNSDTETELNFTLQDLVDKEIDAHTFNGKLRDPKILDGLIKYLDDVADYAYKRVREMK